MLCISSHESLSWGCVEPVVGEGFLYIQPFMFIIGQGDNLSLCLLGASALEGKQTFGGILLSKSASYCFTGAASTMTLADAKVGAEDPRVGHPWLDKRGNGLPCRPAVMRTCPISSSPTGGMNYQSHDSNWLKQSIWCPLSGQLWCQPLLPAPATK